MDMRIGFLGAGKMAEAILAALIRNRVVPAASIAACEISAERRADLRKRYRIRMHESPAELVAASDAVFLAVKPQDLDALLADVAPALRSRHVLISIAAGKTLADLQKRAGRGARLVRVMPNLAVLVGEGMSAFCLGRHAKPADRRLAVRLLGCCGKVLELPERQFDAVTALSGSGPAFFAYVLSCLAKAAEDEGLSAASARLLAGQTMLGAGRYLLETGRDPAAFIQAVASPKGTTAAGLAVLDASDIAQVLKQTIRAAAGRSRELSASTPKG